MPRSSPVPRHGHDGPPRRVRNETGLDLGAVGLGGRLDGEEGDGG